MEMKSLIEIQKRNLQAKINTMGRLNEDCAKLMQQHEDIKREVKTFVDSLISNLETKKQLLFASLEHETKRFLETLTTQKTEIESEIRIIESSLKKADTILKRSTHAEVVQMKKSLKKIFQGAYQSRSKDRYLKKASCFSSCGKPKDVKHCKR